MQAVFDVNLLLLKGKVLEMEKQYKVGIVGATGMVGQRFVTLLENHPWFKLTVLAASGRSAGKTYEEAVGPRWAMTSPMPESVKKMVVLDASKVEEVASQVDFIFCAVNMPKDEIKALEEAYAKAECPVVSNNSANRFTPDVPMVVPEINADHIEIIPAQRKRLGTKRGFIAVKSNCSLQSYVPALHPLMKDFGVSKALVCTYQAISGAGKTFDRMPEIVDNVIPYIGGEEARTAYVLREQGYRDAMRDYGLEVDERYIHNVRMHLLGGRDAYDWVCSLPELPEAIVCMTDTVTYGLMFNLMKNHYRIPEDIAVASGEDLDMSSFFLPGITCSHISIEKMGSEAARLLIGILQGEEPDEREIEIETFLVERDSSKKYAE